MKVHIREGETSNIVTDLAGRKLGVLPFSIRLLDFSIEYYPAEDGRWLLLTQTMPAGDTHASSPCVLDSRPGATTAIPGGDMTVEVLRYLPSARPVYPDGARGVVAIEPEGLQPVTLPAEAGREARVGEPPLTVRIEDVYRNLKVQFGGEKRIVDAPAEGDNPAVRVTVTRPGGTSETVYLFAFMPAHPQKPGLPLMRYVLSPPADVEEDPNGLPAVHLRLRRAGASAEVWLSAEKSSRTPAVSVDELPDLARAADASAAATVIYLAEPQGQVKDYRSALDVIEEGAVVRSKTIEVNHPLRYGGYHFYQFSYDDASGGYTVLSVKSDAGLHVVYVGFALVLTGLFGLFWLKPAMARFEGRRHDGD